MAEKETPKDTIGNLGLGAYYRINDALKLYVVKVGADL